MNAFRFHWRDGSTNEGEGRDAADALNALGFGRGAIGALDYWERVPQEEVRTHLTDNVEAK